MATAVASAAEMIPQLEAARKLALGDPQVYNQVLPGILPIIGPTAHLEVRRWGADFLAEGFASPSVSNQQKEQLSIEVIPTLRAILENQKEDVAVVRSAVQAAASLYSLVFRRVYVNKVSSFSPIYLTPCSQHLSPSRGCIMAGFECHQTQHSTTHGLGSYGCPDLLYQIRSKSRLSRNPRSDR